MYKKRSRKQLKQSRKQLRYVVIKKILNYQDNMDVILDIRNKGNINGKKRYKKKYKYPEAK